MNRTYEKMQGMTFGVEIEYTGASRDRIADLVARVTGGAVTSRHGWHLDETTVRMPDGREWKIESDGSVTGSSSNHGGEVVTPVMTLADMDLLQNVMREMRHAGARTDSSCGQHVHVGSAGMTPRQVQNLVKIFYKQEELIYKAIGMQGNRRTGYAHYTTREYLDRMTRRPIDSWDQLGEAYYGSPVRNHNSHYDQARYKALNLHNLWQGHKHTIEFRLFEGTMHAGEMRANILLAMTMVLKAKESKAASSMHQRNPNETTSQRYDLRVFLLRLGWIGDEFKEPRKHMMKRLTGSAAWKDGAAHGRRVVA